MSIVTMMRILTDVKLLKEPAQTGDRSGDVRHRHTQTSTVRRGLRKLVGITMPVLVFNELKELHAEAIDRIFVLGL